MRGYKQINQVLGRDVASCTFTIRTPPESRNTAIKCSDAGFQGNEAIDDGLAVRIMEVCRKFFRGETAVLDEVVYEPADGTCATWYQNPQTNEREVSGHELTWRADPVRITQAHLVAAHL